ncbi:hypothetical protein D5086_022342 [Populus alba]|uniref:Uncharacterized protein n=1 Tax=Populus alba TaxID=43335 RepID=A0ACC4BG85_POPAL
MKALGWWLMLVGSLRLASVWFGFFDIWALRLAVFSDTTMTEVHGRTFGVWTLLTCTLCFLCAFNLDNKPLYLATFLSFIYAFGHFLTEYLIYQTMAIANLTTVSIFAGLLLVGCAYCGILGYKFFGFPLNPKRIIMQLRKNFFLWSPFNSSVPFNQVFLADLEGGFASRFQLLIWISDTACQGLQLALLVRHIINWTAVLMMFLFSALNASTMSKFLESTRKFTGFLHAVIVRIY